MPILPVELGTPPLGTDGDTAREAFTKVNENFADLDSRLDGEGGLSERVDQNEQDIESLGERVTDTENLLYLLTDPDIPIPTLALLFDSGLPIDPRITFTRASQATYIDALGRIQLAANNEPRLDYDPITGVCRGLLMERAATNTAIQSGNLASGSWFVSGTGATKTVLPTEGIFTPAAIASGGLAWHRSDVASGTITSGTVYAVTWFFKYGTSGAIRLSVRNAATTSQTDLDCQPGSVPPGASSPAGQISGATETVLSGGLRRITATFTAAQDGDIRIGFGPGTAVAGENVVGYGAQLETGTVATSYIPTDGSPATRASDSAVVADLSDWYNSEQGTLLIEAIPGPAFPNTADLASLVDSVGGANDNRLQVFKTAGGNISFSAAGQGSGIPTISTGAFDPDAVVRFAFTYPLPTTLYRDGQVYGPTVGIPEPTITGLNIGGRGAGTQPGGVIRGILYFPRRLSDEQLRALTS